MNPCKPSKVATGISQVKTVRPRVCSPLLAHLFSAIMFFLIFLFVFTRILCVRLVRCSRAPVLFVTNRQAIAFAIICVQFGSRCALGKGC